MCVCVCVRARSRVRACVAAIRASARATHDTQHAQSGACVCRRAPVGGALRGPGCLCWQGLPGLPGPPPHITTCLVCECRDVECSSADTPGQAPLRGGDLPPCRAGIVAGAAQASWMVLRSCCLVQAPPSVPSAQRRLRPLSGLSIPKRAGIHTIRVPYIK